MMSDPLARSSSASAPHYEYGEYDGLVDLDAILHGPPASSPTPNLSCLIDSDANGEYPSRDAVPGPTPSPQGRSPARRTHRHTGSTEQLYPGLHGSNVSGGPLTGGGYAVAVDDVDVTTSPAPLGQRSHPTPPASASNTATRSSVSGNGSRKRGDSAASGRRSTSSVSSSPSAAAGNHGSSNTRNGSTDSGVHLPAILPAQQRRPADTLVQPRVRVSPLTQDVPATTVGTASGSHHYNHTNHNNNNNSNARGAMTVPSTAQGTRPGGAKTVMSANNLVALQRNSSNNGNTHHTSNSPAVQPGKSHTGISSTGTSTSRVPPFLAPPLSPLHGRGVTGPASAPTPAGAPHRPLTDGTVTRGESAETPHNAQHPRTAAVVDLSSPSKRSGGWVKEEVQRLNSHSQEMKGSRAQDRLQQETPSVNSSSTPLAAATAAGGARDSLKGSAEGKLSKVGDTPSASASTVAQRNSVWANDYEMNRSDLIGASTDTFGAMPKVVVAPAASTATALPPPPPMTAQRTKRPSGDSGTGGGTTTTGGTGGEGGSLKTSPFPATAAAATATANTNNDTSSSSSSTTKKPAPFRPPPMRQTSPPPPPGSTSSPVESAITPLKTKARPPTVGGAEVSGKEGGGVAAAGAGTSTSLSTQPHVPQPPAVSTSSHNNDAGTAATRAVLDGKNAKDNASLSVTSLAQFTAVKPTNLSATHAAAAAAEQGSTSLHAGPNTSHRRVMNAVDTSAGTPGSSLLERRAAAAAAAAAGAGGSTGAAPAGRTSMDAHDGKTASCGTTPALPYSEDRRAALEAWAAFPVLDVTIRGQPPTAMQQRRERDFAAARPQVKQQLYQAVRGQAPQEFAGEPFEMNYDVHNVVVQLRHRNRPLMMAYPAQLPLELDMRPRLRRQRTPRSFYGQRFPHVGDTWFRNALEDARHVESPDIEAMEKREEEEFIRNGGDPAQRRNRYGQATNHNQNPPQQQQQRPQMAHRSQEPNIDAMNKTAVPMMRPIT